MPLLTYAVISVSCVPSCVVTLDISQLKPQDTLVRSRFPFAAHTLPMQSTQVSLALPQLLGRDNGDSMIKQMLQRL